MIEPAMPNIRDWQRNRHMWIRMLETRTGDGLKVWNRRINQQRPADERSLRDWLTRQGVTGYPQSLLVMERFGYPDFIVASAQELVDHQYADRQELKSIYDALIQDATRLGDVTIQVRKTYVSLLTARRTFARVQPSTRTRVDLGLRLERRQPEGRLRPSRIHPTMPLQISLASADEIDAEVRECLREAYVENC